MSREVSRHKAGSGHLNRAAIAGAILVVTAVLFGCQQDAALMRRVTYPPDFRYVSDAEIETVMGRLAAGVHNLERVALAEPPDVHSLLAILKRIETDAHALESTGGGSNHPYLQAKLRTFISKVQRSQVGLRAEPPRLTSADEVWQACAGCHARR